jgi:nucleoside-diphosphate-sugar epimerase
MMNAKSLQTIAITGATGFIGQHLLLSLQARPGTVIRALRHRNPGKAFDRPDSTIEWIDGDLADSTTAQRLLTPGGTLINLAFPENWNAIDHIHSVARLAKVAAENALRRVIHCSSAVVVGNVRRRVVNESTEPSPQLEYEKIKLEIERAWRENAADQFDLAIARPSAVFGPGGKNLIKLADALTRGSRTANYVRSALYSRRKLNLVCIRNVVTALEMLIDRPAPFNGETFNISNDDDPTNNFRDVEKILMRELGIRDYTFPLISVPRLALGAILRVAGRSNSNPDRIYDNTKLKQIGWKTTCSIEQGLCEFAAWYLSHKRLE